MTSHIENEFQILSYLGHDLPGALIATPLEPDDVPERIINTHNKTKVVKFSISAQDNQFSLAGVQMKFSMKERDGRYNLAKGSELGDWIIKTPSTKHKFVPLNEYTAMTLASLAGVNIPDIKLVELNKIDSLPQINLPDEQYAFAIKRFDRDQHTRIHMEDLAQVLVKYPHEKYNSANYQQIGKVLYQYSANGLADAQQFARRLLVNILLANGDAHLKNWSLLYADMFSASLSPAYDIVTTGGYINDETEFALNLGKTKQWFDVSMAHFQVWAEKSDIPWRAIQPHLNDTLEKARLLWPQALDALPMDDSHKTQLKKHWQRLQEEFQIK
ncbi:type II toxin-antitoxin system HipA family toxin [Neptunomonas sp.]|uniref:type II toxin-antitoxin system HipA family toxin n=2 Tax=Neptunomonas sp. TaxID=1971898 RepID=UPI003565A5A4